MRKKYVPKWQSIVEKVRMVTNVSMKNLNVHINIGRTKRRPACIFILLRQKIYIYSAVARKTLDTYRYSSD